MVTKLRGNFSPRDYKITLYGQIQNLKKILMIVREYREEFYRINMQAWYVEETT